MTEHRGYLGRTCYVTRGLRAFEDPWGALPKKRLTAQTNVKLRCARLISHGRLTFGRGLTHATEKIEQNAPSPSWPTPRLQIILFIFHPTNNRAPERGQQRFRVLGSNKSIWEEGLNS